MSSWVSLNLSEAYASAGRTAEAEAEQDRGIDIASNPPLLISKLLLAKVSGNKEREEESWKQLVAATPEPGNTIRKLYTMRDRPGDVGPFLKAEVARLGPGEGGRLGTWAAYFGEDELAVELLAMADNPELRFPATYSFWRPVMAGARTQPGFKDIVRKWGLVEYWKAYGWGEHCKPVGDDDFECH